MQVANRFTYGYAGGGNLDASKDRRPAGATKNYPMVKQSDFAGGGRSYPIPTRADAVDALRLAGLHHRPDVKAKVYAKYPELKKEDGGALNHYVQPGGYAYPTSNYGPNEQSKEYWALRNKYYKCGGKVGHGGILYRCNGGRVK